MGSQPQHRRTGSVENAGDLTRFEDEVAAILPELKDRSGHYCHDSTKYSHVVAKRTLV
jgi:hypothetical protein